MPDICDYCEEETCDREPQDCQADADANWADLVRKGRLEDGDE